MPRLAAAVVPRYASMHELATVYGVEDVYDMIEIAAVDAHNRNAVERHAAAKRATKS